MRFRHPQSRVHARRPQPLGVATTVVGEGIDLGDVHECGRQSGEILRHERRRVRLTGGSPFAQVLAPEVVDRFRGQPG